MASKPTTYRVEGNQFEVKNDKDFNFFPWKPVYFPRREPKTKDRRDLAVRAYVLFSDKKNALDLFNAMKEKGYYALMPKKNRAKQ